MKLIIGMTGSTGIIYGVRILEVLKQCNIQTHLVITEWAKKCLAMETDYKLDQLKSLATEYSDDSNLASGISSGTYRHDGMIVIPCSMKTLSSIANGYDETLVARAAGVTLKESRKLVLVTRETPLTAINLENMLKLARLGVVILPPVPGFYTKPKSIEQIIDHAVGKCLDQFNIDHDLYKRWGT
ncbi:UbiX family flavin prenyltransferase [Candidatus Nitrosotenuis aquarius]|uniref:UbiX family flavin prenyltransferase n=1 Tax=Candidatus Nitrosotenuis aquarius TaxID=1846278 RepID=UPI000C1EF6ED|nr:UbiX family flavin prenyltransferase [Candidatus Nitrosotenuis aquarius]